MTKNFRIKLINPPLFNEASCLIPSGAIAVLSAFLKGKGFNVEQEDLAVKAICQQRALFRVGLARQLDYQYLIKDISDFIQDKGLGRRLAWFLRELIDPQEYQGVGLVVFSVTNVYAFIFSLVLVKYLKKYVHVPVVFGGSYVSLSGERMMGRFPDIDYMIQGDSFLSLERLIGHLYGEGMGLAEIPGLMYRDKGKLWVHEGASMRLGALPLPDFSDAASGGLFRFADKKALVLPYQTSRGCALSCSFCTHAALSPGLELRSPEMVVSDLRELMQLYGTRSILFCDSAVNTTSSRMHELCDAILTAGLDVRWGGFAKPQQIGRALAAKMRRAGCVFLLFGVESGSQSMLDRMGKGTSPAEMAAVLRNVAQEGILNEISLIAGYPHETKKDCEETVVFIQKNARYIHRAFVNKFVLEQGSSLAQDPQRHGLENLCLLDDPLSYGDGVLPDYREWRSVYAFDEVNGMLWKKKLKQIAWSMRTVNAAIIRYLTPYRVISEAINIMRRGVSPREERFVDYFYLSGAFDGQ